MRKVFLGVAAVILVATVYGCATTEQSLRAKGLAPQTQKELEERFSKPTKLSVVSDVGQRSTVTYTPDGTGRVEWPGGGDTGRWRVKDGKFCVTWTKLRDGKETCLISYKTGPKNYTSFYENGTLNATSTEIE